MALKNKKPDPKQVETIAEEAVSFNESKRVNRLKTELVYLYKELDEINVEAQNKKIDDISERLKNIVAEYDEFEAEENLVNLNNANKVATEGKMIIDRYAEVKPKIIKEADSKTPFPLSFRNVITYFFIGLCLILAVALAVALN